MRQNNTAAFVLIAACWVSVGAGVVMPDTASAESSSAVEEMRELSHKGSVEYSLGHYMDAVRFYEQAYRLVQDPALLYNIAQAYRLAGDDARALNAYKSFVRSPHDDLSHDEIAERRVKELEARLVETRRPGSPLVEPTAFSVASAEKPPSLLETEARPDGPPQEHGPLRRWWWWAVAGTAVGAGVAAILMTRGHTTAAVPGSAGTATVP